MSPRRKQRGVALLILAVIAGIAFLIALLSGFGKWKTPTTTRRNVNAEVLAQAKSALIGYIAKEALDLSDDVPGRFPCPEAAGVAGTATEGIAPANCSTGAASQKSLGRLPWRTLGIDKLVDADAEPLWYAVAAGAPNGATPGWVTLPGSAPSGGAPMINAGKTGSLSFDGTGNVVAVIFAPGRAMSTNPTAAQLAAGCIARNQSRNDRSHVAGSTADPDFRDYLECQNATSPIDDTFGIAVPENATNEVINDQAVVITASEVLNALQGPLAERMQRTVAPLLSEHADKWIAASGQKFLPYAVSFSAPPETTTVKCGSANLREGLLPTALTTTAGCSSNWTNFSITGTGNSVESLGCSGTPVTCTFRYYTLNAVGALLNFLLNLAGLSSLVGNIGNAGAITATVSSDAPNAALSFRDPLAASSIVITNSAGPALSHTMTLTPKATGEVTLGIDIPITSATNNLCTSIVGLVCNTLPGLMANANTVTVTFPQLTEATVNGTKLTSAVFPAPHTLTLLTPAAGEPHYWFLKNEWYRYTYYAVAPTTSALRSGGFLTVSDFPAANGGPSNKTFVLALTGPAVTGQTGRPSTAVNQYVEGENASTGDDVFAYQVFRASGNDRVATCPFTSGAFSCD
jgi:hypothetical protein